ncbi:hypothetical protein [Liquorilactobacillus capillatus]|uniref:Uncharacterized protein n=1 Tax=Liquorilactobacillus capillatus DSM 19910 TaxID=1423731 RepID=A0A0R1M9M7_9LACO|nr:hypothetical protein [Liquorilactobacillus capillatus]KRL02500.1 hypothetical protein FC81_GL000665 [Liquorilactobacillus capillatus DSM 19910]
MLPAQAIDRHKAIQAYEEQQHLFAPCDRPQLDYKGNKIISNRKYYFFEISGECEAVIDDDLPTYIAEIVEDMDIEEVKNVMNSAEIEYVEVEL